jgi:penicillin-binding protein 1C
LKPWIYVSALDRGILNPNSILDDSEFQSGGYNPSNFDEQYIGKLTLKDALLTSRNIPAIEVLEKLNPQSVEADIRSVIGENTTQRPEAGLSLAVGGFYLSPEELAKLYLVIGNEGTPINLKFLDGENRSATQESKFSSSNTSSLLVLLSKINSLGDLEIVKTGTAAHRQDAWAIMLTKDHLLVVWLGTPQNQPTNSLTGAAAALPIAREIRAALDLKEYRATEKLERERNTLASRFENVNQAACKKLIVYPEDQAWLRSEDLEIAVRGKSNSIEWFVNGETTKLNKDSVRLEEEGFHKITASTSECEETVSIFVEVKGRP